jgi:hypothetical protein
MKKGVQLNRPRGLVGHKIGQMKQSDKLVRKKEPNLWPGSIASKVTITGEVLLKTFHRSLVSNRRCLHQHFAQLLTKSLECNGYRKLSLFNSIHVGAMRQTFPSPFSQ